MRIFRLLKIILTFKRYGLFQILSISEKTSNLARLLELTLWFIPQKHKDKSLALRIKLAFEYLGPVFVKFGQLLSTRPDLIPTAYLSELAKLQNQVKPFNSIQSRQIVTEALGKPLEEIFSEFSDDPVASASIAQVHRARLIENGQEVAVKVFKGEVTSDGFPEDEMNACITAGNHEHLVKLIGKIKNHLVFKDLMRNILI